jgi:hypothetical protein
LQAHRWPVAIGIVYVALRIWSFAGVAGHSSTFPDTGGYLQTEHLSLTSLGFWTWYKPWGTPLLWKLVPGAESTTVPIAQWLLSVATWLIVAVTVYRTLERREVRIAGYTVVLAFSLVPAIAVWDGALLSESLALSLGALTVAAMLLVVRRPTWTTAAILLAVTVWLAGTRTTNGYLAPFLLVPVALVVAGRNRNVAILVAGGALAVAGLTYATANVRQWQVPLAEIVGLRVLHDPDELRYFAARGMPVYGGLEQDLLAARSPLDRFERAPSLQPFLPWFNSRARGTYTGYLLNNLGSTLGDPIRNLRGMVSPSSSTADLQALPVRFYAASGYRDGLPSPFRRLFYVSSAPLILAWTVAALVAAAGLGLSGLWRRTWWVSIVVIASTLPHAIIVWTGDDTSLGRHALLLAVYLRLGLILLTVQLVDAATVRRMARTTSPRAA